jgi:thioesterase domain-containing protein
MFQTLQTNGVLPVATTLAEVERMYRIFLANSRLYDEYMPAFYSGNVTLIKASEASPAQNAQFTSGDNGWGELVQGKLEIVTAPGDHFTMLSSEYLASLAEILNGM